MVNKKVNKSQFYVVHFKQKPFKTIDYYVCVPDHWAIHKLTDKKLVVAYPKHEDPVVTRERVKKREKHKDEWKFCSADLKHQTDTYEDAECWISKENNHRLLAEENSSKNDKQQKVLKDQESCGSNQKHSVKSKDKSEKTVKPCQIPQKSSLKDTNKKLFDESKKQILLKRVSLSTTETANSTAQNTDTQPESSKTEQSVAIRDKQSKENKTEKTAAAKDVKSTEGSFQSSNQNNHKPRELDPSLPIIDLDYTKAMNSKGHSQQEQARETNGHQNQLASNSTGGSKFPSPFKQATQPHQYHNKKLRVSDVRTLTTPSNNQEPRVADQVENIKKDVANISQKPLNLIDPTKPLPMPSSRPVLSTQQLSPANIQNSEHQGPSITNRINCTPVGGMAISSQEIQHVTKINIVPVSEPRVVHTTTSVTAPQNIPTPHQHPTSAHQDVQKNLAAPQKHMQQTRGQELPPKPTGHRPDPRLHAKNRPISEPPQHQPSRPSFNNDPTTVPRQFHQPPEIQYQAQKTVSQQDAQQSQCPVYVPILSTNNRRSPILQEVKQTTSSSTPLKAPISMDEAILTAIKNYPWNEQEIKAILNKISNEQNNPTASNSTSDQSPRIEPPPVQNVDQYPRTQTQQVNRSDETNLTMKRHLEDDTVSSATDKRKVNNIRSETIMCMQEPSSPNHSAALDSGLDTDHETALNNEMSVDEAYEEVNESNQTEHYSVDRLTGQNFLSKLAMEQQKIEQFITIYTQLISNFQDKVNTFYTLRNLLSETAQSYQKFIDNERINMSKNLASHEPSSSNVTQEVSTVVEKRQTVATEGRNSSNGNQSSNNVTKAPERTHQSDSRRHPNSTQQFALPPEYNSNDTKWTLKYQAYMTGLQELIPNTNIYVRYSELKRFEQVSNSCQLLTRLLLHEVFNEKALGVCATMTEIVQINSKMSPDGRPALDNFGFLVLIHFVIQYASRSGWCADVSEIINAIDQEIKEVRIEFAGKSRF